MKRRDSKELFKIEKLFFSFLQKPVSVFLQDNFFHELLPHAWSVGKPAFKSLKTKPNKYYTVVVI
jgi:hypothetical protein